MSTAPATFEWLQEICSKRNCAVQDLFLVGDRVFVERGDSEARCLARFEPFLLDATERSSALPQLLRRLGATEYESLDQLRDLHELCDEFYEIYDALYDSLTDYAGGTAPDGDPLYLPGGYQGVPEIQLHVQSREHLNPAVVEHLQAPLLKYERRWKVYVTTAGGGIEDMRTIAEIYAHAVHAC